MSKLQLIYIVYDYDYSERIKDALFCLTLDGAKQSGKDWKCIEGEWVQEGDYFWRLGDTDIVIQADVLQD